MRAVLGRISGIQPGEKVRLIKFGPETSESTWVNPFVRDVAVDASTRLMPDGSFFIYFPDERFVMLLVVPSLHRNVEIFSATKELCVGIPLMPVVPGPAHGG
ncbi:MAG: hypothetical protein ACLPJH_11195 [Myxococcaceae bacterium]